MEGKVSEKAMPSENKQLRFTISPRDFKLLEKWSTFHGKTPGEFAGQVIANCLEENIERILRLDEAGRKLDGEPEHEITEDG
jgi:hypothetical protein